MRIRAHPRLEQISRRACIVHFRCGWRRSRSLRSCLTPLTFGTLSPRTIHGPTGATGYSSSSSWFYAALLWAVARARDRVLPEFREVYLYRVSTASSNADVAARADVVAEAACPPNFSRFVSRWLDGNQNGTALRGVTVLFLAQVYGLDLTAGQQVRVMLMSILAGIGTAGVPGGSLPMVMIVAQSVGIPAEGMGLILGVDRFLDMCRTAVNVSGDLVITALVSARESGRTGTAQPA